MQEAAKLMEVSPATLKNWEHKYFEEPAIKHWPKIIAFLGYCPYTRCATLPEKVLMYRKVEGISLEQMARKIGIDPGTLGRFEASYQLSSGTYEAIKRACAMLVVTQE